MKACLPSAIILATLTLGSGASLADAPVIGQHVLDAVVERLPTEPLRIEGDVLVRKRRGVTVRELRFEMILHWGDAPPMATYTIRDTFGNTLEQLTLTREAAQPPTILYASGNPLLPGDPPPLGTVVQESDMTWTDLSLAFLWWPDSQISGMGQVRGRDCFIVDIPAPDGSRRDHGYAVVRAWVDRELLLLLQAEGLSSRGEVQRKLWVKSLKKINDRWMIKDLEVQQTESPHRTRLRVRRITPSEKEVSTHSDPADRVAGIFP